MVLVKASFRVCLILVMIAASLAAGFIWGPLGPMVAEPIVRRYGENSTPALKIGHVDGSLYSGIILNGVSLTSGDETLIDADRLMIRPSWSELAHGTLWVSDLEIGGVRVNSANLSALASHYGKKSGGSSDPSIKPIRVTLRDIIFDTSMYPIEIDEGLLAQDGSLALSADLGGLPVRVNGRLDFEPLHASFDVSVGSGRVFWQGKLTEPFDIKGEMSSVKLGELLAVLPGLGKNSSVSGGGEIQGRFNVMGAGEHLGAWGSVGLRDGSVAGLPVEASTSWSYKGGLFSLTNTKMKAMSANVNLKVSADLRPVPESDRFLARGTVSGLSMKNLQRALSLGVSLDGGNGIVDFVVSADQAGKTAGKVFVRLPELRADGKQVVKGLRATALLFPDRTVTLDCTGETFGAKVTGGGSLSQGMAFAAEGIDSALAAAAFPSLAPAAPSGKLNLNVRVRGTGQSAPLSVEAEALSSSLSLAGVKLTGLSASARYENSLITLDGLKARIGKAPLTLAGTLNLASSALRFDGGIKGLDPKSIPELTGVTGLCDVSAAVRGTIKSPEITASLAGSENTVMDIPLRRLALSCTYADNRLTVPETALSVPGGSLSLRGSVAWPRAGQPNAGSPGAGEPVLDAACALKNLDLSAFSKALNVDVTGRLSGSVSISGPMSGAAVSAAVTSDAISVLSADIRGLDLDVSGTTREVTVRRLKARINEGSLDGHGNVSLGRNGRAQVDMKVSGLEIRSLLAGYGIDAGIGGYLDGELSLLGPLMRPELNLKVTSPLTIKETLLDQLAVSVISPSRGKFDMDASGRMGNLDLTLKAHMERGREGWGYAAESGLIDLDKLISAKTPSMKGQISGSAKFRVTGRMAGRRGGGATPVNVTISVPSASFAGMKVDGVSVPIRITGDKAEIREGSGLAYDGKILLDADVDLPKQQWNAAAKVSGLNIGKAAAPFLTQGGIDGSADINVQAKGNYGALMMMFANGDFKTGEGRLHGFDALNKVADGGQVSFQEVRGSFFWDGGDLWLNPGTQATAKPGDALYKYLSVNGPMGLKGKGLGLNFNGNFNVQALDMVLGSLKGLFQLTTGSLTGGKQIIRQAVGRAIGFTERDFQDVSFQLKGSWKNLQLLNLKINKSIEEYMPIAASDYLPAQAENTNDRKIQFNIKIPTGPGGDSDENAEDQFKKQLLDNLLDNLIPSEIQ